MRFVTYTFEYTFTVRISRGSKKNCEFFFILARDKATRKAVVWEIGCNTNDWTIVLFIAKKNIFVMYQLKLFVTLFGVIIAIRDWEICGSRYRVVSNKVKLF